MAGGDKEDSILEALAEDLRTKACIKDEGPVDACSEAEDVASSSDTSIMEFVCKIHLQSDLLQPT